MKQLRHCRLALAVAGVACSSTFVELVCAEPVTWLGGVGSYADPTKWSTGTVPNSTTADVSIDGGNVAASDVTLTPTDYGQTFRVRSLDVTSSDALTIGSAASASGNLTFDTSGPVAVDGALTIRGVDSRLRMNGSPSLGGTGVVHLTGSQSNIQATGDLTIGEGLTLRSTATGESTYFFSMSGLSAYGFDITNRGAIVVESGTFRIGADRFDNFGSVEVRPGAILSYAMDLDRRAATAGTIVHDGTIAIHGTLTNDEQVMALGNGTVGNGRWFLLGRVQGGTIRDAGGALYVPYLSTAVLDNVTLDNAVVALSGSLRITNGIAGTGTITFANPEAIEGSGNIEIGTVPAGITVRGSVGQISPAHVDTFKGCIYATRNEGVIRAQAPRFYQSGALNLVASTPIVNAGRLEVSEDATLNVFASDVGMNFMLPTTLAFADGGTLRVDESGLLAVRGDLDLSSLLDVLEVLPKAAGDIYANQLIATFTGTLTGVFNGVTPGMLVSYLPGEIRITGAPVPEPAAAMALVAASVLGSRRRRRTAGLARCA